MPPSTKSTGGEGKKPQNVRHKELKKKRKTPSGTARVLSSGWIIMTKRAGGRRKKNDSASSKDEEGIVNILGGRNKKENTGSPICVKGKCSENGGGKLCKRLGGK